MKKTVAIIGAVGKMGSAIALGIAAAGYRVLLTDDIKNHSLRYMRLTALEGKIKCNVPQADVQMAVSRREASWEADIIIPAVPYGELAEVASRIKDFVTGKVVISLAVPLSEARNNLVTAPTANAAEKLAQLLPHSKVVKVVSTVFAARPKKQMVGRMGVKVFVAGDDKGAVAIVMELVKDAGFHPLVAGTLATSRTLGEAMAGEEEHAIHH